MDDPETPCFQSWKSYRIFASAVKKNRRYVWDEAISKFVETVIATSSGRTEKVQKGAFLYRAQRDIHVEEHKDDYGQIIDIDVLGASPERMKPLTGRGREGRVNPKGIPVLYTSSDATTAITETRPWIGSEVSVAQFRVERDLRAINLAKNPGIFGEMKLTLEELESGKEPDIETREEAVWAEIDSAFSQPTSTSDDFPDYVPTQILAEVFRDAGYDALIYRSKFKRESYNVALFNLDDATPVCCWPCQVEDVRIEHKQIGNAWYRTGR